MITVHTLWAEKDLIQQIPGVRRNSASETWELPLTWAGCQQLAGIFGTQLQVDPALREWTHEEYDRRVQTALELRGALSIEGDPLWRPYQLADIAFLRVAGSCLLANEPGTGKTVSALTAARMFHLDDASALPMLVVCPNSVKHHWERHAAYWFPEAHVYRVHGGAVTRRKMLREAARDPLALVIINIEAVRIHSRLAPYGSVRLQRCVDCGGTDVNLAPARCEVHPKELNEIPFASIIADEAHRMKDPEAKQTRALWHLMHSGTVNRCWALTGTPVANHVGDLWSIMHGLVPDEYPGRTKFVDRYALFTYNMHGGLTISDIRPDTKDELFRFLDPRMRRMLTAIVNPQLPPKVFSMREAEMIPKQAKAYAEMRKQMFTRLDDGSPLTTTNNLTKNIRLIQLASSYAEIEQVGETLDAADTTSWRVRLVEPSPKVDVLEEIVQENEGHAIAVCAVSRQLIEIAAARLAKAGERVVQITGAVSEFERNHNLNEFQTGRARILLFTIGAGGTGIDMTRASTLVRLQRSYSMLDNIQALGRVHRIGSEQHQFINIIDIIAPGTVEEDQLERLREKEERLESIVRDRAALVQSGGNIASLDREYADIMNTSLLPPRRDDVDNGKPDRAVAQGQQSVTQETGGVDGPVAGQDREHRARPRPTPRRVARASGGNRQ